MSVSAAARTKELLLDTVDGFERADGRSDDPYCREVSYHPMAEAKYLWALGEMLDTGLISRSRYGAAVERSVARLAEADVVRTRSIAIGAAKIASPFGLCESAECGDRAGHRIHCLSP